MTKEGELIRALLVYVTRSIAEQDVATLRRLKLAPSEVAKLSELRAVDIDRLATVQPAHHFLSISFQSAAVCHVLSRIEQLRKREILQKELLLAGAPRAMMKHLFGTDAHAYANWQTALALPYAGGRAPVAGEDDQRKVWQIWWRLKKQRTDGALFPEDYLALYQETALSLRVIWPLLEVWAVENSDLAEERTQSTRSAAVLGAALPAR